MPANPATPRWPDDIPTLFDTERGITLRAHTDADLPGMVEQCRDPESIRWTTVPVPYAEADARWFVDEHLRGEVAAGRLIAWAVEAEVDGVRRYCGTIDLRLTGPARAEFGLAAWPGARGRGIMAAACRMVVDWAFGPGGQRSLVWLAYAGNWPSRWLAESLGFRFAAPLRAYAPQRGELRDCWLATLTTDDPRGGVPRMPTLETDGLRLRAFTEADLPRIVEGCDDPLTQRWMPQLPAPYDLPAARQFVDWCREGDSRHDQWTWCVTATDDDRCLGAVTLFRLTDDAGTGELGYWAHPDARGRGVTSAAVRRVADFALGVDGPHQALTVRCARDNVASAAVARAAGFTETGSMTGAERLRNGSRTDLLAFSRIA
ncbi:GNAT family N-acetyltransferase [Enemella dayhoffiae]|uniref:GNAT family N-acetyltransferase n=1 Tax=Enemella dayhoffiae TaxID=2016507 RepID=A0A255GTL6_9ACTN|nr:GNAT family N-acetyltransferase [Enemella dayhoffiae]OYO18046.1 GNAT family N-acetyltransferase [Enemella dayhoffiae]